MRNRRIAVCLGLVVTLLVAAAPGVTAADSDPAGPPAPFVATHLRDASLWIGPESTYISVRLVKGADHRTPGPGINGKRVTFELIGGRHGETRTLCSSITWNGVPPTGALPAPPAASGTAICELSVVDLALVLGSRVIARFDGDRTYRSSRMLAHGILCYGPPEPACLSEQPR